MNIIIAVNENYVERAKTMLFSLARNNSDEIVVYLLQSSVTEDSLRSFSRFMNEKCHGRLETVRIPNDFFKGVPKHERMSYETYYRLVAFELLPKTVDRALWLDADIIVKGDIWELYNADFNGRLAVACAENTKKHHERLGLSSTHRYFNAGVILFDIAAMRERFAANDVFNCIKQHEDHLDLMDQDVLNLLLMDNVEYREAKVYNNGAFGFNILPREKLEELKTTARIIHYWGSMKPWNWKGANWADKYWWNCEWQRHDSYFRWFNYRLKNAPIKAWHLIREAGYMFSGQLKKITGRKAD